MINKLILKNFKSIGEQIYNFNDFDLLVGRNNSGKSTILQSLAIWQYCIDDFITRGDRRGTTGIQIVLPNFTALPIPEFNLLWKDKIARTNQTKDGGNTKKQEFTLIEIDVYWRNADNIEMNFGVQLRYQSPQTMYALPMGGWSTFREKINQLEMPRIAYVPPFSGLEPNEKYLDIAPIRQQVGKGQPGSVLRNLLLIVFAPRQNLSTNIDVVNRDMPHDWLEITTIVKKWFGVELLTPEYDTNRDVYINVQYKQAGKTYDLISGGSGFHQTLTLLAFFYGYKPSTILLDEPDAHLHVNLQREVLDYFKRKSSERKTQFLIATHAEEFIKGVHATQIISLLNQKPSRIQSIPEIVRALSEVSNDEVTRVISSPYILYVEGESDERLIRAWAAACTTSNVIEKFYFKMMNGGTKRQMLKEAEEHFEALRKIIPTAKRVVLFDLDDAEVALNPNPLNHVYEWKRKNIENYLLVQAVWCRLVIKSLQSKDEQDLLAQPWLTIVNNFFENENLTLPKGKIGRYVDANIFSVVDGKRILFENDKSLFHLLRNTDAVVELQRDKVASAMLSDEIHEDIHAFFAKLLNLIQSD